MKPIASQCVDQPLCLLGHLSSNEEVPPSCLDAVALAPSEFFDFLRGFFFHLPWDRFVINDRLDMQAEIAWAATHKSIEETGAVVLGEDMAWEVFDGKDDVDMLLTVTSE